MLQFDINNINIDDFRVVNDGELYLICPTKTKHNWSDDEKHFRSLLLDKNGFVVSSGWKKFGNYGEFKNDTELLHNALKNRGGIKFTEKMDGSLCIRFVYNNNVYFRTRETIFANIEFNGGKSFSERFIEIAKEKYDILFDPDFMSDRSLLFEYVSPSNLIIVNYDYSDLIFLGFIRHDDLQNGTWGEISKIANDYSLNLVKTYDLPRDPKKILDEISNWKNEGIVVRFNDDQVFLKIKSSIYLSNFRLKYGLNYEALVEVILTEKIESEYDMIDYFKKKGLNWETLSFVKTMYDKFLSLLQRKNEAMDLALKILTDFKINKMPSINEKEVRKNFSLFLENEIKNKNDRSMIKSFAFQLYDNNKQKIDSISKKIILDNF